MTTFRGLAGSAVPVAILAIASSGTFFAQVNEWTRIGPEGGRVQALAADPSNPGTLYAGAATGEIYKTTDGGASWTSLSSQPGSGAGFLVIDSIGTIYTAAGLDVSYGEGYSLSRSADGGRSWSAIGRNLPLSCIRSFATLAIDPSNPGTLYVAANGVCKSTDGGATWAQLGSAIATDTDPSVPSINVLAVDPQNPQTIYANNNFGFFKSADGGANWDAAGYGLPSTAHVLLAFAVDPQNSGTVYIGLQNRIFKTTDGGASWNDTSAGLPPVAGTMISVVVDPQNPAAIYAGFQQGPQATSVVLVTSTDGGASWSAVTDPDLAAAGISTITPDPQDPGTLYLGTWNNGVLKTTDGGSHWNPANSGLKAIGVWSLFLDSATGTLLAGGIGFIFSAPHWLTSSDAGASWSSQGPPPGSTLADPKTPGTLYSLVYQGNSGTALFRSWDFGESWVKIGTIPVPDNLGIALTIAPELPTTMYAVALGTGAGTGLYKSIDGGYNWSKSTPALNGENLLSGIAVDPQDPNTIYAGTGSGFLTTITAYFSLSKSMNGGANWVKVRGPDTVTDPWGPDPPAVVIDPQNPSTIYFAEDDSWYKSTDGGATWTDIPGCQYGNSYILLIDPRDSSTLYATGVSSVCRSTDGGASWTALESGLTGAVNSLVLDPRDSGALYAATTTGLFALRPAVGTQP